MTTALAGCASQTQLHFPQANIKAPQKILVVESPLAVNAGRLQKALAPDTKKKLPASEEIVLQGKLHAQKYAVTAMESALEKQSDVVVLKPKEQQHAEVQGDSFGTPPSQEAASRIRKETGADAVLRFRITDYGLTPRAWRNGYITFEVTSTLAIAGVIAFSGSTAAKAAGGAYLAQEAVEETAETYAGFWGLDVVSRPVRIEAELINLNPVAVLWKASNTGLSDVKLSRMVREVKPDEERHQLDQSTEHAARDLVTDLAQALRNAD